MKKLGSIEKRPNGYRLVFSFGLDPVNGKYRTVRLSGFRTERQADNARAALNVALFEGDEENGIGAGAGCFATVCDANGWKWSGDLPGEDPDVVSVLDLALGFLTYRRTHAWGRYAPMAYRSYYAKKLMIEKHLGEIGKRDASKVTRKELRAFKDRLAKSISVRIAKDVLNVLRPAFEYAVEERDLIAVSPAKGLGGNVFAETRGAPKNNAYGIWDEDGKLKKAPPKILLKREYKAFFEFMKEFDMMWYVYFLVCLASGLRLGAVAGLRRSDCFLDSEQPGLWSKGGVTLTEGGKWERGKGKNHGTGAVAQCQIVLDTFTAGVLKAYLESEEWKRRARRAGDRGADAPVFRTSKGEFPSAGSWRKAFLVGMNGIGISPKVQQERDLTPNTWRHTYITEAVIRGEPLEHIAERVGNTPEIIRKNYLHHNPEEQVRLAWNPLA